MVKVKFGITTATIDGHLWQSGNDALTSLLNAMLPQSGAAGDDPDPDFTAAQDAANRLGGNIVASDNPDYEDGMLY
jgi:hypothetical protein